MESLPQGWRAVDEHSEPKQASRSGEPSEGSSTDRVARLPLALAGALFVAGLVAVIGVAVVAWSSAPSEVVIGAAGFEIAAHPSDTPPSRILATPGPEIVVDVEGAVARPGLYRLASGSRVGDAIDVAGGFGPSVDVTAAAANLNLAAPLEDGDKVHVPALGDALGAAAPSVPAGSTVGGAPALIDLNQADSAALESLPGVGPVTAAAIIAERATSPFATVDDLHTRGVVGPSTFERIKGLVTVGD
jgi:competence protein ComEA